MRMYIAGSWVDREEKIEVIHPFDGSVIDTVPKASAEDIDKAIEAAERGALAMARHDGV